MKKYFALISMKTKMKCAGVVMMALAGAMFASVWPVKLGNLYTEISSGSAGGAGDVLAAVTLFAGIYLASEFITIGRRVFMECIVTVHEAELRERSIEKLLKMPVEYYSGTLSGEKTAELNQGISGLSQLIKIMCNDIFATVLTAVCTLMQVILNAPMFMAGIMLLYLAVTIVISVFQIRSQNGIREDIIKQKNYVEGQICQSVSNIELIRAMNAEGYEKKRLSPAVFKVSRTEKKHHCYMGAFDLLKQAAKVGFQAGIILISVVMIAKNMMPAGTVITVCLLFQQLIKPVDDVYRFMDETASSVVKARALIRMEETGEDEVFSIGKNESCDIEAISGDCSAKEQSGVTGNDAGGSAEGQADAYGTAVEGSTEGQECAYGITGEGRAEGPIGLNGTTVEGSAEEQSGVYGNAVEGRTECQTGVYGSIVCEDVHGNELSEVYIGSENDGICGSDVSCEYYGERICMNLENRKAAYNDDIVLKDVTIANPEKTVSIAHYDYVRFAGGRVTAVVGRSGCGKTTLMKGLNRFYSIVSGKVEMFGKNLKEYSQSQLADDFVYVPQQAFFFAGSVRENLQYGLRYEATDKELEAALEKACLLKALRDKFSEKKENSAGILKNYTEAMDNFTMHSEKSDIAQEWVSDDYDKCRALDFKVGEGGAKLSGGERQRLSIARAFLRYPKMFVFDESTANLDNATQAAVLENIREHALKCGAGVIHISHDSEVVASCDEVVELENTINSTDASNTSNDSDTHMAA